MNLSTQDLLRLNVMRIQRLKHIFPPIRDAAIMVANGDAPALRIGCISQQQADQILSKQTTLMGTIYNVCGILKTSLYYAGECLWEGNYPEYLEQAVQSVLIDFLKEESPMPATLEKPTTTNTSTATPSRPLPAQDLGTIASDLNQSVERIEEYAFASGVQPLLWEGRLLIPGDAAANIYRALWGESLDGLLARRGLLLARRGLVEGGGNYGPGMKPSGKSAPKAPAKSAAKKRTPGKRKPPAMKTEE